MRRKDTYPRWFIVILMLIPALSCTERIDVELDSTYRRLVVEGAVTTDLVRHQVILSITSDYFSNEPSPRVQDAMVELTFGNETIQFIENEAVPGLYETPYAFRGIPGTTYDLDISQLDVNQDGVMDNYHASSTMPGGAELESIEIKYYTTPVVSGYAVFMYAYHPLDQSDWFGFKLIKNSDVLTDSLSKYTVLSVDIFDTGYLPGLPVGYLSDDDPRQAVHPGDTITFELNCIDEAYYNFVTEAQLEIAGNYPLFSGPPANVVTNLDNNAQGIFTAYSIQRLSVIMN
jgi:hypothetical protein